MDDFDPVWYLLYKHMKSGRYIPTTISNVPVASMTDAAAKPVRELIIDIDPVQYLHGYDYPWPAGGGSNIWDEQWEVGGIGDNGFDNSETNRIRSKNYIPVSESTSYYFCIPSPYSEKCFYYDANKDFISSSGGFNTARVETTPAGSAYMRFSTSASYGTTYQNNIAINYPASVTTYSPFANICPITGWQGATIADISDYQQYFAGLLAGTYGYVDLGTLTWERNTSYSRPRFISPLSGAKDGGSTLTGSGYVNVSTLSSLLNTDKAVLLINGEVQITDSDYSDKDAFTTAMNGVYLIYERMTPSTPVTPAQYNTLLSAFGVDGWLVAIDWTDEAGTVYGGTLDPLTGLLTVSMAKVDLETLDWIAMGTPDVFSAVAPTYKYVNNANMICSDYQKVAPVSSHTGMANKPDFSFTYFWYNDNNPYYAFYIKDSRYSDAATLTAALNNVAVIYPLDTPVTIQLTPTQIRLLKGSNNIWATTGDINTLVYLKDPKLS